MVDISCGPRSICCARRAAIAAAGRRVQGGTAQLSHGGTNNAAPAAQGTPHATDKISRCNHLGIAIARARRLPWC
jgi:hypothetical protein